MAERSDDWQEQIDKIVYSTKDPTIRFPDREGHPPCATTMLYRVCDRDPKKFEEAMRLVELFIEETMRTHRG